MRKHTEPKAEEGDFTLRPDDLERMMDAGEEVNVVDVRAAADFVAGHIPGAVSLPREDWNDLSCLRKDRVNVLYCYSTQCDLARRAVGEFARQGYPVLELEGGWKIWADLRFEIERGVMQSQHNWHQALL